MKWITQKNNKIQKNDIRVDEEQRERGPGVDPATELEPCDDGGEGLWQKSGRSSVFPVAHLAHSPFQFEPTTLKPRGPKLFFFFFGKIIN